jgi:cobalt-zinc-cadmium resistance protein CzcA
VLEAIERSAPDGGRELRRGARFPIVLRIDERYRDDERASAASSSPPPTATRVPLSRVAKIQIVEGPRRSTASGRKRRIVVQATCAAATSAASSPRSEGDRQGGRASTWLLRALRRPVRAPRARAQRLLIVVPLALLLIFGLLYFTYHRVLDAVRVFTRRALRRRRAASFALWLATCRSRSRRASASSR